MAFSHRPVVSYVEEGYVASTEYEDTGVFQSSASSSAEAPVWDVDATIDPTLLTQHQDWENSSNNAVPIHHF